MKLYADTNFFTNLYLRFSHSAEAKQLLAEFLASSASAVPVPPLLWVEVRNALERAVFESRHGSPWRVTPEGAMLADSWFESALEAGRYCERRALSLDDLDAIISQLIGRHTAKHGFRTYDILHVASALHLGCDTFWSFDAKALKLAKLEGLKTNR